MSRYVHYLNRKTRYALALDDIVENNHFHNAIRRHALRCMNTFAVCRAVVRENAHKVQYLRVLQHIEYAQQRHTHNEALCHVGKTFHKEQRKRALFWIWNQKILRRKNRRHRLKMAIEFRKNRGASLALWLMQAQCSVKTSYNLPSSHVDKFHYYGNDYENDDPYAKKVVFEVGKTKREIRAEQRASAQFRTPSKNRVNEQDQGGKPPKTQTPSKNKRGNFLAFSIMRSPNLKSSD